MNLIKTKIKLKRKQFPEKLYWNENEILYKYENWAKTKIFSSEPKKTRTEIILKTKI